MDNKALFKLSYGLFILTAKEGEKDNGCIINTAAQASSNPLQMTITVIKGNYTHDMIMKTGKFNVSILTKETPFVIFQNFGFQSGRDTDKFEGYDMQKRSENGIYYFTEYTNAYLSGEVVETVDLGSHTLFVATITAMEVLSDKESATYADYHAFIKPKPDKKESGWRCTICGYIHEEDELPDDFICPICKHGAEFFEKIEE